MSHPSAKSLLKRPLHIAATAICLGSCGQNPPPATPSPSSPPAKQADLISSSEAESSPEIPIGRSHKPPAGSSLDFRPPADPSSAISAARGDLEAIEARVFQNLTTDEIDELQSLIATYHSSTDADDRLDAINAMSDFYSKDLLALVSRALDDNDPSVRQAALELLAGSTSSDVLPLAEKALSDGDSLVRAAAAGAVARVSDAAVVPLFQKGIADSADTVRFSFLDASAHVSRAIQNPVLESAIHSEARDVQHYALAILEQNISSANFDIVLGALDAPDPDFRHEVSFLISNLIDMDFTSAAEARAWWTANRDRYDKDLYLKN